MGGAEKLISLMLSLVIVEMRGKGGGSSQRAAACVWTSVNS